MGGYLDKMERIFSAAAFAEAGEFDTACQMVNENRSILLALSGEQVDRKTLTYAINTCKRVGADIDIIYSAASDNLKTVLEQFLSELKQEGIRGRLLRKDGTLKQEILAYTSSNKEVLFVIVESMDDPGSGRTTKGKTLHNAWHNLRCPLVVVKEDITQTA